MSKTLLQFVLPDDRQLPSGGNIYNAKLLAALQQMGHALSILDFSSYERALSADQPGTYWVDSLFVKALGQRLPLSAKKAQSWMILHHLESLHPPQGYTSDQLFEQQEEKVLQFLDGFLVTSTFSQDYLRYRGLSQPILLVEPATDLQATASRQTDRCREALMVANVIERKGVEAFLQQLAKVSAPTDAYQLTVVGRLDLEPDYAQSCQRLVTSTPSLRGKVRFTGPLPHAEVARCYGRSDVFISAASMETFGMALQEAFAFHLPVLAMDGGYVAHHFNKKGHGHIFNSVAILAKFFIDLVRDQAIFTNLWKQTQTRQSVAYSWHQAAHSFFEQFHSFLKE